MIALLFIVFFIALLLGIPVAFSLGLASLVYILLSDIPLIIIPQKMYAGLDSFVLLSIPGFILAGNLMNASGITEKIINFCNAILGHIRGGLGLANIGASMLFAGISGTAIADTASLGSIMIPAMKKEGYSSGFASAITATSSTVGPIIPPSLPMIIAGTLTGLSVGKLFLAGAVPGLLIGLGLMIMAFFISRKKNHPKHPRASVGKMGASFLQAFWAIMMGVIILFGIVGGFFTPTEASIVAVIYGLLVGFFIYKGLTLEKLKIVMFDSAVTTASLMVLVGFANLFAWILTSEQVPQQMADLILGISQEKWLVLLMINIVLLVVGSFMETIAALLILFPVLLRVAIAVDVDPIHFAVIMVVNLVIGLTTPPVGVCLFVAAGIGKISMNELVKSSWPFLLVCLLVLLLITYVPEITLWLPELFVE